MYPNDDKQFEEVTVREVKKEANGWDIKRSDGWNFHVPDNPIKPQKGMKARFYGKGTGYIVRGLFLGGKKIFYRTEAEEKEKHEIDAYGKDATDWLKRWDSGSTVWSIEMGGLGPGYEQCIHMTLAEIIRIMLDRKYDASKWNNKEDWYRDKDEIEKISQGNPVIDNLGLSGAQWGVALHLATRFYRYGPQAVLADEKIKDRLIQVRRSFPQLINYEKITHAIVDRMEETGQLPLLLKIHPVLDKILEDRFKQ